jgi:hypothetical protein
MDISGIRCAHADLRTGAEENIWSKCGWSDRRLEKIAYQGLHRLYSSPNIIRVIKSRRMRWVGHVARMREIRNSYKILVGKPEGKIPLEHLDVDGEDDIKTDLGKTGLKGVDWNHLAQDRDRWWALVKTVMNIRVP